MKYTLFFKINYDWTINEWPLSTDDNLMLNDGPNKHK